MDSTEEFVFYGSESSDKYNIEEFINKFEQDEENYTLEELDNEDSIYGEEGQCLLFSKLLRNEAAQVWKGMKPSDQMSWRKIRKLFLTTFNIQAKETKQIPEASTKIRKQKKVQPKKKLQTNLSQHRTESIEQFASRCQEEVGQMFNYDQESAEDQQPTGLEHLSAQDQEKVRQAYLSKILDPITNVFFISGIKGPLKGQIMNIGTDSFQKTIEEAAKLEQKRKEMLLVKEKIVKLANTEDGDLEKMNLDHIVINQINQKRARWGHQPFKKKQRKQIQVSPRETDPTDRMKLEEEERRQSSVNNLKETLNSN